MTGTTVFKKNKNMVTRKIADETILLPIYRTSKEINCIYTLNKPASIVWDMIDGKTTVGEIKDKVLNNGFDLIKDSAYRIKDSAGKKIKNKEEIVGEVLVPSRYKEGKAERERGVQRDTQHVSRDARKEVDSQLKVFFGELKEIKAVVKDKGKRIKVKRDNVGAALASARNKKKGRKMKFRPEITRVKLNPEQAVLSCSCYKGEWHQDPERARTQWIHMSFNVRAGDQAICGHTEISGKLLLPWRVTNSVPPDVDGSEFVYRGTAGS